MTERHGLTAWSLDLDEFRFVQALAALGALHAAARRPRSQSRELLSELGASKPESRRGELVSEIIAASRDEDSIVKWLMPSLRMLGRYPSAPTLAGGWEKYLLLPSTDLGTRIEVSSRSHNWSNVLSFMQTLRHQMVGASSVICTDAFASDGRVDWQLPFHFAVLPDDPLANAFLGLLPNWREPRPYRFTVADRIRPHVEIMVFSGSLRQTAGRLLAKGTPSRAALALLLGGMDAGSQEVESLIRVVARELSAEGVVCLSPYASTDAEKVVLALKWLGDELCHGLPLDVALGRVFGQYLDAFLSRDVINISHISHAVGRLSGRLQALPRDMSLVVSEHSLRQLGGAPDVVGTLETVSPLDLEVTRGGPLPQPAPPALGPLRRVSPKLLARRIDESKESYRYFHESDEASSLTEVSNELKMLEAVRAAKNPETRYIQHSFWRKQKGQLVEERRKLTVGVPALLRVRIGPPEEHWQAAPEAFPAHELPRSRQRHRLQVVFHEPVQLDAPMVGELMLPSAGPSSVAEFVFTPRQRAAFEGRITVLHRGRVLQTVLIRTQVTLSDEPGRENEAITQQIEARVRDHWSDLASRRRFDASFVLNHTSNDRPLLTGVSGKRAWAIDLSGIKEPVDSINQLLSDVAHSVADYSEGLTKGDNLELFYKLARLGADLYSALVIDHLQQSRSGGMDVEKATHIQIVSTRADAVVPFEFIYQYQPPDDQEGVRFCPNALQALVVGACPGNCDGQKDPRRHVCPMGFWSLRKVIERHVYSSAIGRPDDAEVIVQAEPVGDRVRLQLDQAALVGYSDEVKGVEVSPVIQFLQQHLKGPVQEVKDWDEWRTAITQNHPTLLVAFPHNIGDKQDIALEIGGKQFKTLRMPREYVHVDGPYPLVMLLGCDVASTAQQYANHIRYFRQAGAAAIVSTIATVFGPHAVKVGEKLLGSLVAIHKQAGGQSRLDSKTCLGEALRETKRKALLDSLPMALSVVAFGDADWRL